MTTTSYAQVWRDIDFGAIMEVADDPERRDVSFKVFRLHDLWNYVTHDERWEYDADDATWVNAMNHGKPLLTGWVKWDGCSDWNPGEGFWCYRGCEREHLINLGVALARCWDEAANAIPTWDG